MAGQVNNQHNNWCKGARHRVSPWGLFPVPGTKDKWIVWNVQPPYLSTSYKIWARRAIRDENLWALEVYILDFSQVAQMVKHLPAMRETWFWFPGWEYTLGKEMATHSSTLAWKIQWTEEPGTLCSPWGCKESDKNLVTTKFCYVLGLHRWHSGKNLPANAGDARDMD